MRGEYRLHVIEYNCILLCLKTQLMHYALKYTLKHSHSLKH